MSHKSRAAQISIAPKVKYKMVKVGELDVFYRDTIARRMREFFGELIARERGRADWKRQTTSAAH